MAHEIYCYRIVSGDHFLYGCTCYNIVTEFPINSPCHNGAKRFKEGEKMIGA